MLKAVDKWGLGYLRSLALRPRHVVGKRHLLFCLADHFEPFRKEIGTDGIARGGANPADARLLVREWARQYRVAVKGLFDSEGKPPQHTFFYPQDEYDSGCVDILSQVCRDGFGAVEIHLHHRNDTPEGLRDRLADFRDTLRREHGLLGSWKKTENLSQRHGVHGEEGIKDQERRTKNGEWRTDKNERPAFAFVHGNWALCNSRPDGDWCGVNEELGILAETGCYADFTFPSAPSPTQPRVVNSIYRAADRPGRPRGHETGVPVSTPTFHAPRSTFYGEKTGCASCENQEPGTTNCEPLRSSLMLIQGPLGLNWARRKWGVLPRLENGDIAEGNPPTPERADLWARSHTHVLGRPEWVFVKLHSHGCVAGNRDILFGESMRSLHNYLISSYNDGQTWALHYVSAREMFNIARAAEDGMTGDPGDYRDYEVAPPPCLGN